MATDGLRAGGAHDAAIVAGQRVDIAPSRPQLGRCRCNRAAIGDIAGLARLHGDTLVALLLQDHVVAGGQRRGALWGYDRAAIGDRAADQHDIAGGRADGALVDDGAVTAAGKAHGPTHRRRIGQAARRAHKAPAGDNLAIGTDDDAVGIDEVDRAGGVQPAVDLRQRRAGHPVECRSGTVVEGDSIAGTYGEFRPIDDAGGRGLVDGQCVRGAADRALSGDITAGGRQRRAGVRGHRCCQRAQRGHYIQARAKTAQAPTIAFHNPLLPPPSRRGRRTSIAGWEEGEKSNYSKY